MLKLIRDNRAVEVGTKIPVKAELARTADDVQALGYKAANGDLPQPPYGPESASKYRPEDYRVALWMHSKATKEIAVPQAYAVPVEAAWMVTRLLMHGVRVERLKQPADGIQCEVLTITEDERVTELQNHRLHSVEVKGKAESRSLPAGTFIVRTDQPLGKMAAYLLEPESEDGLLAWNFLDPDVKPGMVYPIARVMQSVSGTEAIQEVGKVEPLPLNMRWRQARFGHRFCIHRRRTLEPLGPRVIMNCWLAATVSGWSSIRSPAPRARAMS